VKKKALVLAVGLAFATPTISVAKALPSSLVGLSLGEIQSKSYLNEPFKGIIPILFTDINASKKLKVRLAPESIFNKIGAERLSILNSLNFRISTKNNKPVINIESTQAIQLPFLNFILEIEGPQGSIYQDYTTLLDPKSSIVSTLSSKTPSHKQLEQQKALVAVASSKTLINTNHSLKVKSGDTLSQIAQALNSANISLKNMIEAIHQRNPSAFVNNNINRLKAGAVLHIPTNGELKSSNFKVAAKVAFENKLTSSKADKRSSYTIKNGDNLSTLTKKLGHKGISFTKMMKAIHTANPHAFSKNKINLLKVGKTLKIPTIEEITSGGSLSNISIATKSGSKSALLADKKFEDSSENTKEFVLDGFVIENGDTLAKITKQIGHKSVPYSKMMHAIYVANPDAFEKNNITTLIEGSIIRLPSISEIEEINSKKPKIELGNVKEESIKPSTNIDIKSSNSLKKSNNVINNTLNKSNPLPLKLNKLEKRVRELKRDLSSAHSNLSNLELSLAGKEVLLKQQSKDLANLASTLELLNNGALTDTPVASDISILNTLEKETFSPANLLNIEKVNTDTTLLKSNVLTSSESGYIPAEFNQTLSNSIKNKLTNYSQYMSGKELFASILALLFGLALVRYRREIYAYTNISYDHPKYYPPFGEEEARELLKAKSISYQDTLIDPPNNIHEENKAVFSESHIQECEDLADELIGKLEIKTTIHTDNANWDELDKACDNYIEEYKENNTLEITDVSNNLIEGASAEPEEMTFELFESLAEGITNAEPSSTSSSPVEDDTLIYGLDDEQIIDIDYMDAKKTIPFDKLATLAEEIDLDKIQAS
jgi:FimV-like protein